MKDIYSIFSQTMMGKLSHGKVQRFPRENFATHHSPIQSERNLLDNPVTSEPRKTDV